MTLILTLRTSNKLTHLKINWREHSVSPSPSHLRIAFENRIRESKFRMLHHKTIIS